MKNILDVQDLTIHYLTEDSTVRAVNGISFTIGDGETLGLVGETGAGKTTTALGILRLVQSPPGEIISGKIIYNGEDLLEKSNAQMREIRGERISMIFQDPMTALNPVLRVGEWYQLSDYKLEMEKAMFVLAEVEGQVVCLVVDDLVGKQEIVVKPIPDYIKKVKGLSGCTQLGDGSIALILDIAALIK